MITGQGENRDDVSIAGSIAQEVERDYGKEVVDAFAGVFDIDPPVKD